MNFLILKQLEYTLNVRLPPELEMIIYDYINGLIKLEIHDQLTKCMNFNYHYNPSNFDTQYLNRMGRYDYKSDVSFNDSKTGISLYDFELERSVSPVPFRDYVHPSECITYRWERKTYRLTCLLKNIEYSNAWGFTI